MDTQFTKHLARERHRAQQSLQRAAAVIDTAEQVLNSPDTSADERAHARHDKADHLTPLYEALERFIAATDPDPERQQRVNERGFPLHMELRERARRAAQTLSAEQGREVSLAGFIREAAAIFCAGLLHMDGRVGQIRTWAKVTPAEMPYLEEAVQSVAVDFDNYRAAAEEYEEELSTSGRRDAYAALTCPPELADQMETLIVFYSRRLKLKSMSQMFRESMAIYAEYVENHYAKEKDDE